MSAEIHQRKKKEKEKVDHETQTEEQVWTETGMLHLQQQSSSCLRRIQGKTVFVLPDYYNYYYGGYAQNPEASNAQEEPSTDAAAAVAADAANGGEVAEVTTSYDAVGAEVAGQPDNSAATSTEVCSATNVLSDH